MFWSLFYGVGVAYSYKWMLDWPGVCHLVLCFLGFIVCVGLVVFSGVWRFLDVSRETRRFYNNPFVSRGTLFLLYDVPRMSMCFTWNIGFESYSVAGKCGSASQGIDMHDYFLEVRKSKTDDVFFPICRLLAWMKLIQPLGKFIYANRWKIRKNMLSSLSFVTSGN